MQRLIGQIVERFALQAIIVSILFPAMLWAGWWFGRPPEPEPTQILYAAKIYATRLTSADATWIAEHCDLLVTDGSSDAWTLEMKFANPDLKLFRYFTTCVVREPTHIFISSVPLGNLLHERPNWFWTDTRGDPVSCYGIRRYLIDPAFAIDGWADYWTSEALKIMGDLPYDGVHGDLAVIDIRTLRQACPDIDNRYITETDFHAAQERYLSMIHFGLNAEGKQLILNNVTANSIVDRDYLIHTRIYNEDGFNRQGYAMRYRFQPEDPFAPEEHLELLMDAVDGCAKMGKIVMLGTQPRKSRADIEYCIGCYLLVRNDPYVYLNIDWGGNYGDMQMLFEDFGDILEADYGEPIGARYKSGRVWVRDYSRGTVKVNPQTHRFEFEESGR